MSSKVHEDSESSSNNTKSFFYTSQIFRDTRELLEKSGYVDSGTTLAKVSIAHALKKKVEIRPESKLSDREGITLSISQFDANSSLATLVRHTYFSESDPSQKEIYDAAEILCEIGISDIAELMRTGMTLVQIVTAGN